MDQLYAAKADPWNFASSDYERREYAATLDALPQKHFQSVFEIGCSIGILTRRLALRCNALLAIDVAEAALMQARDNCAGLQRITFQKIAIPKEWSTGSFDRILLSEAFYFLGPDDSVGIRLSDAAQRRCGHSVSHDAFGHLKAIGATEAAKPLLDKAGVEPDDGVISLDKNFVAAVSKRYWDRGAKRRLLA